MKICKDCNIEKPKTEFYGVQNECKICTRLRVKKNQEKVGSAYDNSEKGVIRVIYKTQKRHQKLRGHGEIAYTKKQLEDWLYENGFSEKYQEWKNSGFDKNKKPSIDRINDNFGYSFENIRLVTWLENKLHQYEDIMTGVGTSGKRCKPLLKLDEKLSVVCEYVSYNSAARDMGYSLEYQIKNGTNCRSGFFWKYK